MGGDSYDDAAVAAAADALRTGATMVPAFDDLRTIAGQGTVGVEIVAQLGRAARGASCSRSVAADCSPGWAAGWPSDTRRSAWSGWSRPARPSMAAARATGAPVVLSELDTFVDGAAVRRVGDVTFPLVRDCRR